jgi:hypothetical protein
MRDMTTLDLRPLTLAARIAALNEAVAKLDGWECRVATRENPVDHGGMRLPNHFSLNPIEAWWKDGDPAHTGTYCMPPRFATSCDAVMPLLEKQGAWRSERVDTVGPDPYQVEIDGNIHGLYHRSGWQPTLPVAACIALLRAHGVEVLT